MGPDNPRGARAVNISIAMGLLATAAVSLRVLARSKSKAPLAVDDWIVVASLLPLSGMICSSILSWSILMLYLTIKDC